MVHLQAFPPGIQGRPLILDGPAGIQALPALLLCQAEPLQHGPGHILRVLPAHDLANLLLILKGLFLILRILLFNLGTFRPGASQLAGNLHIHGPGGTIPPHHRIDHLAGLVQAAHDHGIFGKFRIGREGRQLFVAALPALCRRDFLCLLRAPLKFPVSLPIRKRFNCIPHISVAHLCRAGYFL